MSFQFRNCQHFKHKDEHNEEELVIFLFLQGPIIITHLFEHLHQHLEPVASSTELYSCNSCGSLISLQLDLLHAKFGELLEQSSHADSNIALPKSQS